MHMKDIQVGKWYRVSVGHVRERKTEVKLAVEIIPADPYPHSGRKPNGEHYYSTQRILFNDGSKVLPGRVKEVVCQSYES